MCKMQIILGKKAEIMKGGFHCSPAQGDISFVLQGRLLFGL